MSLSLISAPTDEPVSLAEAKLHCRVDISTDDDMITAMIVAARQRAEHETGRRLMTQTWDLLLDAFPAAEIELRRPPVQSITHVKYYDTTGTLQTLDASLYSLDSVLLPGWLLPAYNTEWPDTYDTANAVQVRMVCGYATAAAVPAAIKQWILLQVGAMYAQREALATGPSVSAVPGAFVDGLLDPYRLGYI